MIITTTVRWFFGPCSIPKLNKTIMKSTMATIINMVMNNASRAQKHTFVHYDLYGHYNYIHIYVKYPTIFLLVCGHMG